MFGLSDLTSISADLPPSARSDRTPPPDTTLSRFKPLERFRPVFSLPACVCICVEVRRCAFGVYAESPVHTDFHSLKRQQSLEVQSVRARQSAKVKALGNRFYAGKVLR